MRLLLLTLAALCLSNLAEGRTVPLSVSLKASGYSPVLYRRGVAVYRDNCKRSQPLSTRKSDVAKVFDDVDRSARRRKYSRRRGSRITASWLFRFSTTRLPTRVTSTIVRPTTFRRKTPGVG